MRFFGHGDDIVERHAEMLAIDGLLTSATSEPRALVLDGDPGIGKTVVWLAALERAREKGFHALSTRAAQPEPALAYTALADLRGEVDESVSTCLPAPQRRAIESVPLRTEKDSGHFDILLPSSLAELVQKSS
jgi:hypothetical protein